MVFQSYTLFPWLTVSQNIAFGLNEKGMPERESREIVASYIEKVGLKGLRTTTPSNSPAACSSARRLPARLPMILACCFWMSPSARSTTRPAR